MHLSNDWLNRPLDDTVLWRYMDFIKFVSLLDKSALFFPRADKLEDAFEGYKPRTPLDAGASPTEAAGIANIYKKLTTLTLISCWHESPHESEAMWKLYSRETDGITIRTNFSSLRKCFAGTQHIRFGKVNYIDHATDYPDTTEFSCPFLHKRKSFEHEDEVRGIIQDIPDGFPVDFSPVYDAGNYYEVDLSILIHDVVVAPYAQDWLVELVQSVAARYNLEAPVNKSKLGEPPPWGS